MLDIADERRRWAEQGRDFAVATVVTVGGSAPRPPGEDLAVDADGTAVGSVSGGCVVRERFGYSDEDAFAMGLTGGNHEFPMQISPESHS